MKMKKIVSLLLIMMMSGVLFTSCGGGGSEEPAEEPAPEQTTEETVEEAHPVTQDEVVDLVFSDMGGSPAYASEIKVSTEDAEGNYTMTFKYNGTDCKYVVKAATGEIVEKDVPEGLVEETSREMDPYAKACDESLKTLGDEYHGGEENMHVTKDGENYIVEFDWNGDHYTFRYNETDGAVPVE